MREGLEATLIVAVVGAFLRRNGRSVRPMVAGVTVAVAVSIAVGAGLDVFSAALPQRQQEMLETVIGMVAVVFVTTMIVWMSRNAVHLKGELEHEAAQAINSGGAFALAMMAFLAVLKEGFETAVFLLAAAQATHGSRWAGLFGGLAGIAVAIIIGIGIYVGGLKFNLGRFFRVTGVFLVFIAAGLVMSALRTAHEAGWIEIGQQRAFDLSSWLPATSLRGALITGMFGIQSDPRMIEVLGWLLYAVPVLVVFLWPAGLAASARARRNLFAGVAAALAACAAALAIFVPAQSGPAPGDTRTVTRADGRTATVTLGGAGDTRVLQVEGSEPITLVAAGTGSTSGLDTQLWQAISPADPDVDTPTATLAQLTTLTGGRIPVGLGNGRAAGPFTVTWSATTSYFVSSHGDSLISASAEGNRIAVLRGGGLNAEKTVSLGGLSSDWRTSPADDATVTATITRLATEHADRTLWRVWLPILLAAAAATTAVLALRAGRSSETSEERQHHHDQRSRSDAIGVS